MSYRCAYSRDSFVRYLVTSLICRGYWFYVTGIIPEGKDRESIDRKLIRKYDCEISRSARWRRKKNGQASVRYIRCGRFFVLIATKGRHRFFDEESGIHDIRRVPLKFDGYSISFRRDGRQSVRADGQLQYRVHVRIEAKVYRELLAEFEYLATRLSTEALALRMYELPFQGYAPVRRQLHALHRAVNRKRRHAGRPQIPRECLFLDRRGTATPSHQLCVKG